MTDDDPRPGCTYCRERCEPPVRWKMVELGVAVPVCRSCAEIEDGKKTQVRRRPDAGRD